MSLAALLTNANVQWVLAGTLLLGASSGILGSFALLRRRSLMGDVLAHTALPGVCIAFIITQSRSIVPLLFGAVIAGLVGSWCVDAITRHSRIKEDSAQALVLTVFFGFGAVLLTQIARSGAANQSGLDRFLFGQAASLVGFDVQVIAAVALLLTAVIALLFKEFKLLCFDPEFAHGIGFPVRLLDRILMLLIVCTVAIGLQAVGVVLMSAMLITPAAAARYWTERLDRMVILAGVIGALSGAGGTLISLGGTRLATGPLIVLAATGCFLISLGLGTKRGLLMKGWRRLGLRRKVARENLLRSLYEEIELAGGVEPLQFGIAPRALAVRLGWSREKTRSGLSRLERAGLIERVARPEAPTAGAKGAGGREAGAGEPGGEAYRFTPKGLAAAHDVVRRHRLWEMFLMYEADFAVDHVDRDADDIEHHLPEEVVRELERRLRENGREPVLPPSVHPLASGR